MADGLRVLVCGSSRFGDREFVFGLLDGFAAHFNISAVLSGPFAGADSLAREWAKERGVVYERVAISGGERLELEYFDAAREIPPWAIKNDPMFKKGYEKLRDAAASVVWAIPAPDGELGPTCACIKRMAAVIGIECMDASEALKYISVKNMESA